MSCRESGYNAVCEVLVSLVDAACGSWKSGVFVGFQSFVVVSIT